MSAFISLGCSSSFICGETVGSRAARLPRLKPATLSYRASASAKTTVISEETGPKKPARGITKPKPVSPAMQAFLGVKEIPRTQALKQIWAYIKQNNLQDPENKKIIVCDEKLKSIFGGRDRVGFLEISGLLNPHFVK
ncbi:upstream activation factor subunit spp27 [Dendrobium catenatum]|uniref:Zinc finger CCCH domain-containing protein 19 n=1 Tax=Dendrobium catenatum TaxID=906689 RepID=A0A2I0W7X6_9ASPA|nr:upstream activation factor subunit spp27 [Dendrobium catenatum]PKU71750.1 Zinc finger CCCH domain-containing protein 19 [Dendrobium catenatum]